MPQNSISDSVGSTQEVTNVQGTGKRYGDNLRVNPLPDGLGRDLRSGGCVNGNADDQIVTDSVNKVNQ